MAVVDVDAVHAAREAARAEIGKALAAEFAAAYETLADPGPLPHRRRHRSAGGRCATPPRLSRRRRSRARARRSPRRSSMPAANMTDVLAALAVLGRSRPPGARGGAGAISSRCGRMTRWSIDKWFSLQARSSLPDTPARVRALTPPTRPSTARTRTGCGRWSAPSPRATRCAFTIASGAGYVFLADEVMALDPSNPTTAARLVQPLGAWRRHDPARQALMQRELERVLAAPGLSKNTYEMVSKSLA